MRPKRPTSSGVAVVVDGSGAITMDEANMFVDMSERGEGKQMGGNSTTSYPNVITYHHTTKPTRSLHSLSLLKNGTKQAAVAPAGPVLRWPGSSGPTRLRTSNQTNMPISTILRSTVPILVQ